MYIEASNAPNRNTGMIKLHDQANFKYLKAIGQVAATALDEVYEIIKPGITTAEIDRFIFNFAINNKVQLAPLYYKGYPRCVCTSVNHVVCHGIPGSRVLKEGDIVNVDVTFIKDGWHGDTSRMFAVGDVSVKARKLIEATYKALYLGIEQAKPGNTLGDIGYAIQKYIEDNRMSVVRDFCGHGIGRIFHDSPNVMHFGKQKHGVELKPGMVFTIEPMVNLGKYNIKLLRDGWTAVTRDRELSAQFEHMIGITDDANIIFTESPSNSGYPLRDI